MSRDGIDRLCAICTEVQSRAHTLAELADHFDFLSRAPQRRDLFNTAPTAGLIPGSSLNVPGVGAVPSSSAREHDEA